MQGVLYAVSPRCQSFFGSRLSTIDNHDIMRPMAEAGRRIEHGGLDRLEPIDSSTLADRARRAIEDLLVSKILAPGDRIIETALAERLGVSRGPVREAIRHLVAEGVLANYPYRGTVVANPDPESIVELYSVRAVLEGYAARLTCAGFDASAECEFGRCVTEIAAEFSRGDTLALIDLDVSFHRMVAELSGNRELASSLDALIRRIRLVLVVDAVGELRKRDFVDSHEYLLSKLAGKNPAAAERAFRSHLIRAGKLHAERVIAYRATRSAAVHDIPHGEA
jgi:DNA-binding GntR family transcriptional regulator